jgi:hypothetical protein
MDAGSGAHCPPAQGSAVRAVLASSARRGAGPYRRPVAPLPEVLGDLRDVLSASLFQIDSIRKPPPEPAEVDLSDGRPQKLFAARLSRRFP